MCTGTVDRIRAGRVETVLFSVFLPVPGTVLYRVEQDRRVLSPELQECMDRNEGGAATSTRGRYETATPQR